MSVVLTLALLSPMLGMLAGLFWMIANDIQPPVEDLTPEPKPDTSTRGIRVVAGKVTTGAVRRVVRPSYQPYEARHA